MPVSAKSSAVFSLAVLVAALGYFVDIYDLLLFNIVRIDSLAELGLDKEQVNNAGEWIISIQMAGLLIGGIIWGVMGDKRGRLSVLFGSIILYSLANIVNGFVTNTTQYALVRFVAGVGLAGELGAGVTLVSELVKKEHRGISNSIIAGIGILGAVFAYFISMWFHWRTCYFIGGGLGFLLLLMRVSVAESQLFTEMASTNSSKGSFRVLFGTPSRIYKYLLLVLIGLPTWYTIGILVAFSNKFAIQLGISEAVLPKTSTLYAYAAASAGGLLIGLLSNRLKSRKKALLFFFVIQIAGMTAYFLQYRWEANYMYFICGVLGLATGYWALFVTISAESFGTNVRATATTTIPNMVRGAVPLLLLLFNALQKSSFSYVQAGLITGIIVTLLAITASFLVEETYGRDLNFVEK